MYRLDANARPRRLGQLQALHGGGFVLDADHPLPAFTHGAFARGPRTGLYPGLPWFLDDARPQGFLGRAFARRFGPDIGAPADLRSWQADDIVLSLLRFSTDGPGDLLLGDAALEQAMQALLQPTDVIDGTDVPNAYALRADAALRGELVGSSAAGEQPKFTARLHQRDGTLLPVIVKFSERADTAAAQRWADLLHCEHLAGEVLCDHGLPAAESHVVIGDGRVFLQSTRFDRNRHGGRHGFVSLAALDAAHYGHGRLPWWDFAAELQCDGWLEAADAQRLAILGWFGALIGNTDMHLGNAGLVLGDGRPLALAPSYDMLPMLWSPGAQGALVEREFQPALPNPQQQPQWREAAQAAQVFWREASVLLALSPEFRRIATHARTQLQRAMDRFG